MPFAISRLFSTPGSTASSTLDLGSRGPKVLELQRSLRAAGFDPQGLDGDFGAKTQAAVLAFQRARGLEVDGKVGPRTQAALSRAPLTVVTAPTAPAGKSIDAMLAWAKSPKILGSPYAAVNPFRFGEVPWDGKRHKSENGSGRIYDIPKGCTVFDCSGFVVAAYRKAGVDLMKHGLTTTAAFHGDKKFLRPVATPDLKPGDLILYNAKNGIGHVVIYLGNGQAIEAQSKKGVSINPVQWDNIKSCRRVPVSEIG